MSNYNIIIIQEGAHSSDDNSQGRGKEVWSPFLK